MSNGDYYNQTGDYSGSSTSIKGLNVVSQNRIVKVKWYLGNSGRNNPGMSGSAEGSYYYSFERTKNIVQHIGLMYPSDYSYTYAYGVDDICYTNGYNCDSGTPSAGWLFSSFDTQWTQSSPDSYSSTFVVSSSGSLFNFGYGSVNRTFGVRPTLYLSSSIKIVDGDGSQGNPYILGD